MSFLEVKNLNINLKKNKANLVNDLSFNIEKGEVVLLAGRNGSGKSSILRTIMLERIKTMVVKGDIFYNNQNILKFRKEKDIFDYRRSISYIPQLDNFEGYYNMNVNDVLQESIDSFNGEKAEIDEIKLLLEKLQKDAHEDFRFDFNSNPSELSGGQQRIVTILANFIARPGADFYIIDEPFNNLDESNTSIVINLIKEMHLKYPSSTFLIVTHPHQEKFDFITRKIYL